MRFNGKLKVWHEDRGFGFIEPLDGGQDIFLHATALPRGGPAPRVGELLSFEIELNPEGKKRAARVERPALRAHSRALITGDAAARPATRRTTARVSGPGLMGRLVSLAVVVALGFAAYREFQRRMPPPAGEPPAAVLATPATPAPALPSFRCDGRQHCSQMSSCAEAKFFLANCPNTKMDGDRDGIPCEDQHCRF